MIRFSLRLLGYFFIAVAFLALILDGVAFLASGEVKLMSAGRTWTELAPATLNQTQYAIQEHLGLVWFWDHVIVWILLQPTFAVLAVIGLVLCLLGRRKKRKGPQFAA